MQGIQFQENYIQRLPAGLSVEQIIRQLAQPLVAAELVVPDFANHVLKREATYQQGCLPNHRASPFRTRTINMSGTMQLPSVFCQSR